MAMPQLSERILLTAVLVMLFLGNLFAIWYYLELGAGVDFPFVLIVLQAIVFVVSSTLFWTNRATGKLTQYSLIALGFYLLTFGLCVGYIATVTH